MGKWAVAFADDFVDEVAGHSKEVQDKIAALALVLEQFEPATFAFDPERKAILLAAGNKQGVGEARFYRELIKIADARFDAHLATLK